MRKIYLLLLFFSIAGFSQKKEGQALIDSLLMELPKMKEDTLKVNVLNDLSFSYQDIDPKIGIKYAQTALNISRKIQWNDGIAYSYRSIGMNNSVESNYDNALTNYFTALKFTKNKKITNKIFRGIGLIYTYQNQYPKALLYDNKSLEICEKIKDYKGIAAVLSNIGIIYIDLLDFNKAKTFFEKAIVINEKMGYKTYLIKNYGNLGNCYSNLKNNTKALEFFTKAIDLCDELGNKNSKAINLSSSAIAYFDLKNYEKSLELNNQAIVINQEIENSNNLAFNYSINGDNYLEIGFATNDKKLKNYNFDKALENYDKGIKLKLEADAIKEVGVDYSQKSKIYKSQEKFKEALASYEKSILYKDSIFNSENKETIKNLEDKREIELRDKEIKINKLSIEANQKQKWFYILGLGFLATLGGLLYYQSRKRKRINLKLGALNQSLDQANKTKTRFFSILNHDLRSPVANLIHFLHLQKDSPELLDEETKNRMQNKTIIGAENLLSSMEDILLWSKGQMENFKPQPKNVSVNQLFEDTKKVFSGYLKIKFEYHNPENIEIFTDENYLKTIIRNLTSNAINVLDCFVTRNDENPIIIWKAWQSENNSFLSITDNGSGASQDNFKALYDDTEVVGIKTGLGLHLIRDLAKAIDCEISVDSKIGIGTTFVLKLT